MRDFLVFGKRVKVSDFMFGEALGILEVEAPR
jgi:hypothetical protein